MPLRLMIILFVLCAGVGVAQSLTQDERVAIEKRLREAQARLAKNEALNDAFHQGQQATSKATELELAARGLAGEYLELAKKQICQQWREASEAFRKASEIDPKADVIWARLADCYGALAGFEAGASREAELAKAVEASTKAIELKPDVPDYYVNYALTLVKMQKFDDAQAAVTRAAQLNPFDAGKYFFNLGAVLVTGGQLEPAGRAFKKAVDANPDYADAQYQYASCLASKASTARDGRIILPPGTVEAFQKYLKLEPNGQFADAAKRMLSSLGHD